MERNHLKNKIKLEFGKILKNQRKSQSVTQEGLALKADVSLRYLQDLEAGNKMASIQTVLSLCYGLNVSPDDLLLPILATYAKNTEK